MDLGNSVLDAAPKRPELFGVALMNVPRHGAFDGIEFVWSVQTQPGKAFGNFCNLDCMKVGDFPFLSGLKMPVAQSNCS